MKSLPHFYSFIVLKTTKYTGLHPLASHKSTYKLEKTLH